LTDGPLVARVGSRTVTVVSGLALAASLVLPGLAGSWFALAAALAAIGAIDAVMDVAMNAHGVLVERRYERPILTSFHGLWSTGATTGALVGVGACVAGAPRPNARVRTDTVSDALVRLTCAPGAASDTRGQDPTNLEPS